MDNCDFGMYMADIYAAKVQYGSTTEFCTWITSFDQSKPLEILAGLLEQAKEVGLKAEQFEVEKLKDTTIETSKMMR